MLENYDISELKVEISEAGGFLVTAPDCVFRVSSEEWLQYNPQHGNPNTSKHTQVKIGNLEVSQKEPDEPQESKTVIVGSVAKKTPKKKRVAKKTIKAKQG